MPAIFELNMRPVRSIGGPSNGEYLRARSLRKIADDYQLSNVSYFILGVPDRDGYGLCGVHTYAPEWWEHYLANNYASIDPVVRYCRTEILPIDWRDLAKPTAEAERLCKEAREFGIGRNGLSYPIHGARGETAVFSLNSTRPDDEWNSLKQNVFDHFQRFSIQFHVDFLKNSSIIPPPVELTPRETECLKWAAAGKTTWETGVILGVADKTVEFHMDRARVKLGAVNKVQAVARAVRQKLI